MQEECESFLITTECFEATYSTTIARFFEDTIVIVAPEVIDRNDILLFITVAAPYIVKAVKTLNIVYPKMVHLTCLVHFLHRVCEEIRSLFPNIDLLISNAKKIFSKSTYRNLMFKKVAPHIPMPPKPIVTRWGTWLTTVNYYCENLDELDVEDANSIKICRNLVENAEFIHKC